MATAAQHEPEDYDPPEEGRAVAPRRRSSFSILRGVILSLSHIVEDSTELIGAAVHEELARFREDMARHAVALVAMVTGAALATAGLVLFLSERIGMPLTLLIFGGVYLAAGIGLSLRQSKNEDAWK